MQDKYDVAQICLNGHVITWYGREYPDSCTAYCSQCGEQTIVDCQGCHAPIRGAHVEAGVPSRKPAPQHCHCCGKAYPWTERKNEAALEMFLEELDIEKEQEEQLRRDLTDIASDNPRTQVASLRIRRLLAKAGAEGAGMLRDLIVDIASEAAKKAIWPGSP